LDFSNTVVVTPHYLQGWSTRGTRSWSWIWGEGVMVLSLASWPYRSGREVLFCVFIYLEGKLVSDLWLLLCTSASLL